MACVLLCREKLSRIVRERELGLQAMEQGGEASRQPMSCPVCLEVRRMVDGGLQWSSAVLHHTPVGFAGWMT